MKIDVSFSMLDRVRLAIGANLIEWNVELSELDELRDIKFKLKKGIELEYTEVDQGHGLFAYKGQQVVLYIKDHSWKPEAIENPEKGNKVHLTQCTTLDHMQKRGRIDRYVATTRRDDVYLCDVVNEMGDTPYEKEISLYPCKNCLKKLNYNSYKTAQGQDKISVVKDFSLTEYFETYSTFFTHLPTHTDASAPLNHYVEEWSEKSKQVRKKANWICSECRVGLSDKKYRKWLHVHHINGNKSDNLFGNLKVLCLLCHAGQPGHKHMQVDSKGKKDILKLRKKAS
jgi:hypothetical protein